ncbi:MAG: hypothetical protein V8T90_12585 [Victivallales bacterium]
MQMKTFMVMTLLSALAAAGYGLDIQLSDGTILQKVKVTNVSSRGIEVMHKYGGKKILPEMIAENDRLKLQDQIAQYYQLLQKRNERKLAAEKKRLEREKIEKEKQQQLKAERHKRFLAEVENLKKQEPQTYFNKGNEIFQKYKKDDFDYAELKKLIAAGKTFILSHPKMHQKEKLVYIFVMDSLIKKKRNDLVTKSGEEKAQLLRQIKEMQNRSFAVFSSLDTEDLLIASWCKEIDFSGRRKLINQLADGNSTDKETAKRLKEFLDSDTERRDSLLSQKGISVEDIKNISVDSQQIARVYDRLFNSMLCKNCKGAGIVTEKRFIHATGTMIDTGLKQPCKACDSLGVRNTCM